MAKQTVTEQRQQLIDEAVNLICVARNKLQEVFDDLDEKRANMEEKFSQTERYQRFETACSSLEDAIETLSDAEDKAQPELP